MDALLIPFLFSFFFAVGWGGGERLVVVGWAIVLKSYIFFHYKSRFHSPFFPEMKEHK